MMKELYKSLRFIQFFCFLLIGCALLGTYTDRSAVAAEAFTLTVNTSTDDIDANPGDGVCATAAGNGICTLRAAVMETNAQPGPSVILLPAGFYTLTIAGPTEQGAHTGDLDIFDHLTIQGAGAATTVIDGGGIDRIFDIVANQIVVQIEGVTIRNGQAGVNGANVSRSAGSAIVNRAELYLTDNVITQNRGYSAVQNKGRLIATNLTVSANLSQTTAIESITFGTLSLENSQIISNSGAGIFNAGSLSIISSTIAGNGDIGVSGVGDMTIERSKIRANGGIGVFNGDRLHIIKSEITDNGSDGLRADGYLAPTIVEDSLIQANGARGIVARWLQLWRSTVSKNQGGGIQTDGRSTSHIDQSVIRDNQGRQGSGIYNNSRMIVSASTIANNSATEDGGGIYNSNALLIERSTISGNRAGWQGGGIYQKEHPILLVNSTISSNYAALDGGGIASTAAPVQATAHLSITLYGSTIVSNTAGGSAGGLYAPLAYTEIANSVLAYNTASAPGGLPECSSPSSLVSLGYNAILTLNGCTLTGISTGNQIGVDPQLGILQENGGPTETHKPLPGSPLIDAGDPTGCTSIDKKALFADQRGYLRLVDGNADGSVRCDIGAVEFGDAVPKSTFISMIPSSSSAVLSVPPTQAQIAETGSLVSIGLVLGGALLSSVLVLFLADSEKQQALAEGAETANMPLSGD